MIASDDFAINVYNMNSVNEREAYEYILNPEEGASRLYLDETTLFFEGLGNKISSYDLLSGNLLSEYKFENTVN